MNKTMSVIIGFGIVLAATLAVVGFASPPHSTTPSLHSSSTQPSTTPSLQSSSITITLLNDCQGSQPWHWHITAANNRIVADSAECYANEKDCREQLLRIIKAIQSGNYEVETKRK
jgi:uncharacterized protein YegP (UPF0339 family)